jgi:mRNA interferase HigB
MPAPTAGWPWQTDRGWYPGTPDPRRSSDYRQQPSLSRGFFWNFWSWVDTFPKREHIAGMRIIAWGTLGEYAEAHPETKASLTRWHTLVKAARWTSMDEVRQAAPNATVLNGERVKFELAGGNYRLIVAIHFRRQVVYVNFIGTHAEYDKVDALTVWQF